MHTRSGFLSIYLILILCLLFPVPLRADKAAVTSFITNDANQLKVYARVINCFTKEMDAAILAGIPTTFTFFIEVYQERRLWPDKKLVQLAVSHTIKYDNIKKNFYVYAGREAEPTWFRDYESAKRTLADLNGVSILPMKSLKRNEHYYVRVKAKTDKVRLPLQMEYIFIFASVWDFETDWNREGFFY